MANSHENAATSSRRRSASLGVVANSHENAATSSSRRSASLGVVANSHENATPSSLTTKESSLEELGWYFGSPFNVKNWDSSS